MKQIFLGLFCICISLFSNGQTTGIGTTTPDTLSILDIQSTSKGVLLPRVTTAQRLSIDVGSTNGMIVYDLNTISFWYYGDGDWQEIKSDANREWFKFQDSLLWSHKNIGIGGPTINPAAVLDIQSTSKGILIPRVTTAQRNAMSSYAVDGLLVFDAEEIRFFYYTPGGWMGIGDFQQSYWVPTGNSSISSANTQNVGIGTQFSSRPPQYKLDVEGRIRIRQSPQGEAGIWLDSVSGSNPTSFIGVINDSTTGIWGQNALGWGLSQNNRTLNVGIGTTTPHSSAILHLNSTNKAFLPTRMTYNQMLAIPSPQAGMVAYDTDAKTLRMYDGAKWIRLSYPDDGFEATGNNELFASFASSLEEDYGTSIVTDNSGNVYLMGTYSGEIGFFGLATTGTLNSDVFLVKMDSIGNVIWSRSLGNTNNETGSKMVLTSDNYLIIAGIFENTTTIGPVTMTGNGNSDAFIAKYDLDGNFVYTFYMGGDGSFETFNDLTADNSGNFFVTGSYEGTFRISHLPNTLAPYGESDVYIIKFLGNAQLGWIQRAGNGDENYSHSIDVDNSGNAYVHITGSGNGFLIGSFNMNFSNNNDFIYGADSDGIIAKINNLGTVTNVIYSGYVTSLTASRFSGGCYIYQPSKNKITRLNENLQEISSIYTGGTVSITTLIIASNSDLILLGDAAVGGKIGLMNVAPDAYTYFSARLSSGGSPVWYNPINVSGEAYLGDISTTASGSRIYITGGFNGKLRINNGTINSIGAMDLFIWKYLNL